MHVRTMHRLAARFFPLLLGLFLLEPTEGGARAGGVAEVVALSSRQLAGHPPVLVAGRVISVRRSPHGGEALVEDALAGIRVVGIDSAAQERVDGGRTELAPGDEVEVSGRAEAGDRGTLLRAERIVVRGRSPLPPPRRCDAEAFFAGHEVGRLVAMEGVVERAWIDGGDMRLEIQAAGRLFDAVVPGEVAAAIEGLPDDPRDFVDVVVRVGGPVTTESPARGGARFEVRVERPEWLGLSEPAPAPLFRDAAAALDSIGRYQPGERLGRRVRTFGQVIHAIPGTTLFLQNGHIGAEVRLGAGAAGTGERFVPGDLVEVAGFLDRSARRLSLRNAAVTRVEKGAAPAPLVATAASILDAHASAGGAGPREYDGCLVRFSGVLVQSQPVEAGGVLLVRCDDVLVAAEADAGTFAAIGAAEPGSFLSLTGVAFVDPGPSVPAGGGAPDRRLRLLVRDGGDCLLVRRPPWWTPARLLAILAATAAVLATALVWAATLRRQLGAQTRRLAAEMRSRRDAAIEFEATLRERNRLAANLHDTLQQTIGGIGFQLDACQTVGGQPGPGAQRHLAVARRMVDHAAKELQASVWAMRSLPMDGKPFAEVLAALVSRVCEGHDVVIAVHAEGRLDDLPEFVSGNLLLLVQEAVHNALRHGRPTRIAVAVANDPATGMLRARVEDDGLGFVVGTQAGASEGHFGIHGMQERAERLGGSLVVSSRPGGGTVIEAVVGRRDYDANLEAE